jgi:hypothetical protein
MRRPTQGAIAAAAIVGFRYWRRVWSRNVKSTRKIANAGGVSTWSAWRKGRVG